MPLPIIHLRICTALTERHRYDYCGHEVSYSCIYFLIPLIFHHRIASPQDNAADPATHRQRMHWLEQGRPAICLAKDALFTDISALISAKLADCRDPEVCTMSAFVHR